jgi:hypothetical protein
LADAILPQISNARGPFYSLPFSSFYSLLPVFFSSLLLLLLSSLLLHHECPRPLLLLFSSPCFFCRSPRSRRRRGIPHRGEGPPPVRGAPAQMAPSRRGRYHGRTVRGRGGGRALARPPLREEDVAMGDAMPKHGTGVGRGIPVGDATENPRRDRRRGCAVRSRRQGWCLFFFLSEIVSSGGRENVIVTSILGVHH